MDYLNDRDVDTIGTDGRRWTCTFVIVFSTVPQLTFKKANEQNQNYEEVNEAIFQKKVKCRYDFLWGMHLQGDGWLVPRQEPAMRGQIPKNSAALPQGRVGTCIYVSGLPDPVDADTPTMTAEMLFRVCGQYGPIVAAKVLAQTHNAKKAILQFQTEQAAEAMRKNFDNFDLFGQKVTSRKSQLPNASNWSGALSEKWMFSLRNEDTAIEADEKMPPTRAVLVHDWGPQLENEIMTVLKRNSMEQPLITPFHDKGTAVLDFRTREDALKLIGLLNGAVYTVTGGATVRARMSFSRPVSASPTPVEDKPPELVSSMGALSPNHMQMLNDGFAQMKARSEEQPLPSESASFDYEGSSRTQAESLSIEDFLAELKLSRYTEVLKDEGFDYAADLIGFENGRLEKFGLKPGHVNRIINALRKPSETSSSWKPGAEAEKRSRTEPTTKWNLEGIEDPRAFSCPVSAGQPGVSDVAAAPQRPTPPVITSGTWALEAVPPSPYTMQRSIPGADTVQAFIQPGGHASVLTDIPCANSQENSNADSQDLEERDLGLASLELGTMQRDTKTLHGRTFDALFSDATDSEQRSKTLDVFSTGVE
eukprot:TRINITY_DN11682_c0_g2_i2.p1 TRINITY_DN11682_c0_g2~~TRINITY_DN11682_c0_g2_i2.p1  ORF type:complete len:695 (+),score=275.15 TRINITY_DN11682_c0_g2_i2:311-2086(+)